MKIIFLIFFVIIATLVPASALTLKIAEQHYLVSPKDENDIHRAIYDAAPALMNQQDHNNHKYVGMHEARYTSPSYSLKYVPNKICFIESIHIGFHSKIYLPKLDMAIGRYSDKTLMKFETELHEIKTHELKHRQIYISHLQNLLYELRSINQKNSQFKDCQALQKYIERSFKNTNTKIQQKNLDLDCYEYGNGLNLAMCQDSKIQHKKASRSSFSSLAPNVSSQTNVTHHKDESQHSECQGKLIEPFKGKFYCVPEEHYSE